MTQHQVDSRERRVVVTGLGTVNPIGNTVQEYWTNLKLGHSGIRMIRNIELHDYHIRFGGEVDYPENIREYFEQPKMIKRLDRYIVMAHIAGIQALRDSKLESGDLSERCGAIIGSGAGGVLAHQNATNLIHENRMNEISPFYIVSCIPSTGTAFFAKEAGIRGPCFSICSACSTGNHAFGQAYSFIKTGIADIMFAGGSESAVNEMGLAAFGNILALSGRNENPEKASRPFDADRDGFVLGEGAGVLCLEELEHAERRKAHIYAEIAGFGFTSDAHDLVAPHPEAEGAVRAIKAAMDMAGLEAADIDLINAHGTATPIGDKTEGIAINNALNERGSQVPVHSTKSMTGHLLGGASAIEAIAAIMAFEENIIHPTANHDRLDPEINLNVITTPTDASSVNHILSNAFGFGGLNAVLILKRYQGML
ncbi:hypothetical protein JY97_02300 [Alkalispirochaeta odontotermitis]|nr:hypothetical protein JY97_02300 [Alkalispirochaeta odontotermitis]